MSHIATRSEAVPARSSRSRQPSAAVRIGRRARRYVFLIHRWMGIGLATLMALWALSGIVMMYVAYPQTSEEERLAGLAPIEMRECCTQLPPEAADAGNASVEMLLGSPVLRWQGNVIDLRSGTTPRIAAAQAAPIAASFWQARNEGRALPLMRVAQTEPDQWTVTRYYTRHVPLWKASFSDKSETQIYVSGVTGEVIQDTTKGERFWNWLGAVPHWLYFTALRQNGALWSNVVIYASVLGIFLTATGIYVGLRQYGRGKRRLPYRGMMWWHHMTGLVFGLFTLTWVLSGLFSMNPWGLMEWRGSAKESAALKGRPTEPRDLATFVKALQSNVPAGTLQARLAMQGGDAYAILYRADGSRVRATLPDLSPAPLSADRLRASAKAALPGTPIASQGLLYSQDAYYYRHRNEIHLPVWRVIYGDEDRTRLYLDPRTGELLRKVDPSSRASRWWFSALHRFDVGPLNSRPLWDIVMLPLMLGVSLLCLIGLWVGIARLRRRPVSKIPAA